MKNIYTIKKKKKNYTYLIEKYKPREKEVEEGENNKKFI